MKTQRGKKQRVAIKQGVSLMTTPVNETVQNDISENERPNIFEYLDYRQFVNDFYQFLKSKNPKFSETSFILKANFSQSSRGYLGLIIKGKRNLTNQTIHSFAKAMGLNKKEKDYFEVLVNFCQSKNSEEKKFYQQKLLQGVGAKKFQFNELNSSQYRYFAHWYIPTIRELLSVAPHPNDPGLIAKTLTFKVTTSQVQKAIQDLLELGLIQVNGDHIEIVDDQAKAFIDNKNNFEITKICLAEFFKITDEVLNTFSYEKRSLSSAIFKFNSADFEKIRQDISDFRRMMIEKYETSS
jgi:uncharacterized protein (TIGR02147 family)